MQRKGRTLRPVRDGQRRYQGRKSSRTVRLLALGAADGVGPSVDAELALGVRDGRLEALVDLPAVADVLAAIPESAADTGKIGRAKHGGLDILGSDDRDTEHIGLDLHQEVVGGGTAIDPKLREADPGVILHGLEHVARL